MLRKKFNTYILFFLFIFVIIGSLFKMNTIILSIYLLYSLFLIICNKNYIFNEVRQLLKENRIMQLFVLFLIIILLTSTINFTITLISGKLSISIISNLLNYYFLFIIILTLLVVSDIKLFFRLLRGLTIICSFFGIIEALTGYNVFEFLYHNNLYASELGRIRLFFGYSNYYSIFLLVGLIIFLYFPYSKYYLNITSVILITGNIFFTQTRSTWIALIIVLFLYLIKYKNNIKHYFCNLNKYNWIFNIFLLIILILIFIVFKDKVLEYSELFIKRIMDIFDTTPADGSKSVRVDNLVRGLTYLINNPLAFLIGKGAGWGKIFLQINPYIGQTGAIWTTAIDNQYLTIWLEFGIIALLLVFIIIIISFYNFFKNKNIIVSLSSLGLISIFINLLFLEGIGINGPIYFLFLVCLISSSIDYEKKDKKIGTSKKNVVLLDIVPENNWTFLEELKKITKQNWILLYWNNGLNKSTIQRYIGYILNAFSVFLNRESFNVIIAWQQFYGIFLSFYSRLLNVENNFDIKIMTFIYKKKNIFGKIYFNFINYSISSDYVSEIICFSKNEISYYQSLFPEAAEKFKYTKLGIESISIDNLSHSKYYDFEYYISVGRSNRDYKALFNNFEQINEQLIVICNNLKNDSKKNITVLSNTFGNDYLALLKHSKAVIIYLDDPNISSGQLVLLHAMQLKVPIIISKSNSLDDYVKNDYNAIIINKDCKSLMEAIKKLNNESFVQKLITNGYKEWQENFSMESLARQVSNYIIKKTTL